jgi:predicted DNA-binding protein
MTTQILIRVDEDLKNTLHRLSRLEQKSLNEKIRELIEEYVREHNMETAMKNLWDEIGESLKKKGYKKSDVDKMIKKARAGK